MAATVRSDNVVSLRTLQRRARAAGQARFAWSEQRDAELTAMWLISTPAVMCAHFGCKPRTLYARAIELDLPPRNPVKRAIAAGHTPRAPMRLPTCDELLRASRRYAPAAELAARGLSGGHSGGPRYFPGALASGNLEDLSHECA